MNISNELALYYGTRLLPSLVIGAVVAVFMYFFVSIAAFFIAAAIGVCAMFVTAIIFLARTINNQPQVAAQEEQDKEGDQTMPKAQEQAAAETQTEQLTTTPALNATKENSQEEPQVGVKVEPANAEEVDKPIQADETQQKPQEKAETDAQTQEANQPESILAPVTTEQPAPINVTGEKPQAQADSTIVSSAVAEEEPKAQPAPDNPLLAFMDRHRGIVGPQPQQGGAQDYYPPGWDINQYNGTNAQ